MCDSKSEMNEIRPIASAFIAHMIIGSKYILKHRTFVCCVYSGAPAKRDACIHYICAFTYARWPCGHVRRRGALPALPLPLPLILFLAALTFRSHRTCISGHSVCDCDVHIMTKGCRAYRARESEREWVRVVLAAKVFVCPSDQRPQRQQLYINTSVCVSILLYMLVVAVIITHCIQCWLAAFLPSVHRYKCMHVVLAMSQYYICVHNILYLKVLHVLGYWEKRRRRRKKVGIATRYMHSTRIHIVALADAMNGTAIWCYCTSVGIV